MGNAHAFYQVGTTTAFPFTASGPFDVMNTGTSHLELLLVNGAGATFLPNRINVAPAQRATVQFTNTGGGSVTYYPSYYTGANPNLGGRYRGWDRGKTLNVAPVGAAFTSMKTRTAAVYATNRFAVTASGWAGRYMIGAAPIYGNGAWGLDVLTTYEGYAESAPPEDIKTCLDAHMALQLTTVTNYCPVGAVPDIILPSLTGVAWGTENLMPADFLAAYPGTHWRNAQDHNMACGPLAWQYGATRGFDATWATWFNSIKAKLTLAYNAVPYNAATGLMKQWDTYPSIVWSYLDHMHFTGDILPLSILAYNFAAAMQDCCTYTGDTSGAATWQGKADALQAGIRAVFVDDAHGGYLCVTHNGDGEKAHPASTAYAVWSGILTPAQNVKASDWLAYWYAQDKAAGGAGQVYMMRVGARGSIRGALTSQDYLPTQVWQNWVTAGTAYYPPFGTYENGGYWFMETAWVTAALAYSHPEVAVEFATNAAADCLGNPNAAPEHFWADGTLDKPQDITATASLMAMVGSGSAATITVTSQASAASFPAVRHLTTDPLATAVFQAVRRLVRAGTVPMVRHLTSLVQFATTRHLWNVQSAPSTPPYGLVDSTVLHSASEPQGTATVTYEGPDHSIEVNR